MTDCSLLVTTGKAGRSGVARILIDRLGESDTADTTIIDRPQNLIPALVRQLGLHTTIRIELARNSLVPGWPRSTENCEEFEIDWGLATATVATSAEIVLPMSIWLIPKGAPAEGMVAIHRFYARPQDDRAFSQAMNSGAIRLAVFPSSVTLSFAADHAVDVAAGVRAAIEQLRCPATWLE